MSQVFFTLVCINGCGWWPMNIPDRTEQFHGTIQECEAHIGATVIKRYEEQRREFAYRCYISTYKPKKLP